MTIGERLKESRISKGLTLEEAGKRINSTKQNLYKYENGIISNIPSDKIEALSLVYEVSPAYLMGWVDEEDNWMGDGSTAEQEFAKSPGQFIKATRDAKGMSQEELASKAGISIKLLKSLELDIKKQILMSDLEKIAKVFNIDPWEIVGRTPVVLDIDETETQRLVSVYESLSDKGKEEVVTFAQYILQKEVEEELLKQETSKELIPEKPILTIAAHKEKKEWTEENQQDVDGFMKFVKDKKQGK